MNNSGEGIRNKIEVATPSPNDAKEIVHVISEGFFETFVSKETGMTREDFQKYFKEMLTPEMLEDWKKRIAGAENEKLLVAKRDNVIVGVLHWRETPESNLAIHFFVKSEVHGAGMKLLHAARKAMNQEKDVTLWVSETNTHAKNLFERIGFIPTGKTADEDLDTPRGKVILHNMEMTRKMS